MKQYFTKGEYSDGNSTYNILARYSKLDDIFEILTIENGTLHSAYKATSNNKMAFNNKQAERVHELVTSSIKKCRAKSSTSSFHPALGSITSYTFTSAAKTKPLDIYIEMFQNNLVGCIITASEQKLTLSFIGDEYSEQLAPFRAFFENIPYITLTDASIHPNTTSQGDDLSQFITNDIPVRKLQEISLEKDTTWLKDKKYYVVNDDAVAEKLFVYLENYPGIVAYDTETTGLRINCFGKVGSKYEKMLSDYNEQHTTEQIHTDRLVGVIFCVEENTSYYFPCFNRKFKNLYEDVNSPTRKKIISDIKQHYLTNQYNTEFRGDIQRYILNTPEDELRLDVIMMERIRQILEKRNILTHNGTFDYKVNMLFGIDTNIVEDTIILHQIMYKFRSTTSNRGESSAMKYLAKREFGIDQLELHDFFPDYKEDDSSTTRSSSNVKRAGQTKKKKAKIDFSYMDYDGSRAYAPADGDVTLMMFNKYKRDMLENHRDMEYIYKVEVIVSCSTAYTEFYGYRIDENKILGIRDRTKAELIMLESELRQSIGYSSDAEIESYSSIKTMTSDESRKVLGEDTELIGLVTNLRKIIDADEEHVINLSSPQQVSALFYDMLGYPLFDGSRSVSKKAIKALLKAKEEDGSNSYPVAHIYSTYKGKETLLSKFFDNLPDYFYPNGFIFSHFGQIAAATGRMTASKPNCQQFPKAITNIVEPRDGNVFIDADFSQIEYRVLTGLAKNEGLAKLFSDPDSDYHTLMASLMYDIPYENVNPKQRGDSKSLNFGIPYGMGDASLAILLFGNKKQSSIEGAREKKELYFKNQPNTRSFFDNVKEMARVNGYTKTLWNRYRYYSFTNPDGSENNARKAAALRQAGNAVIQGTAADIFKIAVARNFMYIRNNNMLGELLIVNMVHDEMLFELSTSTLNIQKVLGDIGYNMQLNIEGFPPLFVGAGVGPAWGKAKGKLAEIHPTLLQKLTDEMKNSSIWRQYNPNEYPDPTSDTKRTYEYFNNRVIQYSRDKIAAYLQDPANRGKWIHPEIGSILNLRFTYGHDKDAEGLDDKAFTKQCITEFISHELPDEGLAVEMFDNADSGDSSDTSRIASSVDEDTTEEYEDIDPDSDEAPDDLDELDIDDTTFTVVDESSQFYGASVNDLINAFNLFISTGNKICGIKMDAIHYSKREKFIDYLYSHICDKSDMDSMEIVFLVPGNILNHTDVYVRGLADSSALLSEYF